VADADAARRVACQALPWLDASDRREGGTVAEALPAQLVVQTTASALAERRKLRRHSRRFDIAPGVGHLLARGGGHFHAGEVENSTGTTATLTGAGLVLGRVTAVVFVFGWPARGLGQTVPLAVIIAAGVVFYALRRTTRQDVATEPVTAARGPAVPADPAG